MLDSQRQSTVDEDVLKDGGYYQNLIKNLYSK